MTDPSLLRRRLLRASLALPLLPALQACRVSLPPLAATATTPEAAALLRKSADAHGMKVFDKLRDVNVSYAGEWHKLVAKVQPKLVDAGFRGGSQERLLLREGLVAQAHTGPSGNKHVVRHIVPKDRGTVQVWFNGEEAHDDRRDAAALVVDGYSLFLFGPMLIQRYVDQGRSLVMALAPGEKVVQEKGEFMCDVLRIRIQPGLGFSDADQLALYIDRDEHILRRIRFTLEGLESTRGALAEVDTMQYITAHGIRWPTRFHEKLLRPAPLQVHDWRLTGLDVDRRLDLADVSGSEFSGKASRPATPLPG